MWLTALVMLITYLMSDKDTSEERKSALLKTAVAGGVTYGLTEYTDWGKEINDDFNSAIGVGGDGTPTKKADESVKTGTNTNPNAGTTRKDGSLWTTLSSWGAAGTAAVIGTTGVVAGGGFNSNLWIWLAAGAAAIYILTDDDNATSS